MRVDDNLRLTPSGLGCVGLRRSLLRAEIKGHRRTVPRRLRAVGSTYELDSLAIIGIMQRSGTGNTRGS
jgi:hypothetical protein